LQTFVTRADDKPLFSNAQNCELAVDVMPVDNADAIFVDLVARMAKLISALQRPAALDRYEYISFGLSAAGAFVFALAFGVGFTYWRAWWLNNERERDDGEVARLREQVERSFGTRIDFDAWLIKPLLSINRLTPLEAIRYEDYRGKLF